MPDITDAQAVRFCNEELRPVCDRLISAIRTLRQFSADYVAKDIAPLVAGTQELLDSTVADGSATDGRTPITGYDVNLSVSAADAILTWLDGAGASHVTALTKPTVNSQPVF